MVRCGLATPWFASSARLVRHDAAMIATLLFTDIEGSTRLWEQHPEAMREVLAQHDAICRAIVQQHHGTTVKSTGDGIHAWFADPVDAVNATVALQRATRDLVVAENKVRLRCGLHAGIVEARDSDTFGPTVNRAARIMSAGHGGQILVSGIVADLVRGRLPPDIQLQDMGELRLRDVPDTTRVCQVVQRDLPHDFPPLRSLAQTPNNLPEQLTSFVAREKELADIRELLGKTRLLTLHGPGGIGKTRLALQAAATVLAAYPGGVSLVEFAGLSDPRAVALAVASAIGVKEDPGRPLVLSIIAHLTNRRVLLILDNSEHLLQSCASLARDLLEALPLLTIVASSREPLHLAGELTYNVPPLATPTPGSTRNLQTFAQFAAVRLFRDRAAAVRPDFSMTSTNVEAIAQVCRRLDGIPLAIELAAARTRSLGIQEIAARLDDRFAILKSKDATLLPRQQTLRALIDWSYDLLPDPERALLRSLAVFSAGWMLDAAEQICIHAGLQADTILDLLTNLVDKSLVVMEASGDRYRLLDSVQQYALERLRESGEERRVRDAHLAYYLALTQRARPELVGAHQRIWLDRLDLERANILAAHAWCDQADNGAELGLQLISATRRYWIIGGLLWTGHRLASEAIARPGAQARTLSRCKALFDIGQIGSWMGRYVDAQRHLQESLAIAQELDDQRAIAIVLQPLAMACHGQGDLPAAREYLMTALQLARQLGDEREIASAMTALAQVLRAQNDLHEAEPLYREALSIARKLHDDQIVGIGLVNVAMVLILRHDTTGAREPLIEALSLAQRTGMRSVAQSVLDACAGLAAARRECQIAARLFGAAEAHAAETGLKRDATDEAFLTPLIARAAAETNDATFENERAAGKTLDYASALAEARAWLTAA